MIRQPKVTVDNNFFNGNVSDETIKPFLEGKVLFYPCWELIGELLSMYGDDENKKELLKKFSSIFLKMKPQKILSSWKNLVLNDIGITQCLPYLDDKLESSIKDIFCKLSAGEESGVEKAIAGIKDKICKDKNNMGIRYTEAKNLYPLENTYENFKIFYSVNRNKFEEVIMKEIFKKHNIQVNQNEISKILNQLSDNSFFKLHSLIQACYIYDCCVDSQRDQKIDKKDSYDQMYLVYLAELDYLISNDRRLTYLGSLIFPHKNKVSKLEDILQ